MTLDERINHIYRKYWITISYDLTRYSKDRRYTRYKIAFPKIVQKEDGSYDLDLKDCEVQYDVKGSNISYYMALKRRMYPEYMKILEDTVKRKEDEWKKKREADNGRDN